LKVEKVLPDSLGTHSLPIRSLVSVWMALDSGIVDVAVAMEFSPFTFKF
jgi:hypothetical protein